MMRRIVSVCAITAILLVPALAGALPRPDGFQQIAPESQVGSPINVQANDSVGVQTPLLSNGRSYRLAVTGTWKPSGSSTNFADAGFETTNGTTWQRTGKGLIIGPTNYGGAGSPLSFVSNHQYSIQVVGRGITETLRINDSVYSDNTGSLSVTIFQQALVTWEFKLERSLDELYVEQTIPDTTITPGNVGPINVPGGTIGGNAVPNLGSLTFGHDPDGAYCLYVTYPNGLPSVPVPLPTKLGCTFDPGQAAGVPLPGFSVPIGGGQLPSISVCNPSCQVVPGVPLPPITIPGTTVRAGIPAGTIVKISFSWSADTTRLWKTFVDDESGSNVLYGPFRTNDVTWYQGQVAQGKLGVSLQAQLLDPNGNPMTPVSPSVTIAGIGQLLEAMFATKLGGL